MLSYQFAIFRIYFDSEIYFIKEDVSVSSSLPIATSAQAQIRAVRAIVAKDSIRTLNTTSPKLEYTNKSASNFLRNTLHTDQFETPIESESWALQTSTLNEVLDTSPIPQNSLSYGSLFEQVASTLYWTDQEMFQGRRIRSFPNFTAADQNGNWLSNCTNGTNFTNNFTNTTNLSTYLGSEPFTSAPYGAQFTETFAAFTTSPMPSANLSTTQLGPVTGPIVTSFPGLIGSAGESSIAGTTAVQNNSSATGSAVTGATVSSSAGVSLGTNVSNNITNATSSASAGEMGCTDSTCSVTSSATTAATTLQVNSSTRSSSQITQRIWVNTSGALQNTTGTGTIGASVAVTETTASFYTTSPASSPNVMSSMPGAMFSSSSAPLSAAPLLRSSAHHTLTATVRPYSSTTRQTTARVASGAVPLASFNRSGDGGSPAILALTGMGSIRLSVRFGDLLFGLDTALQDPRLVTTRPVSNPVLDAFQVHRCCGFRVNRGGDRGLRGFGV